MAQSSTISVSSTNTPYSRYGLGQLADGGTHISSAMGGVGYAMRSGRALNPLNPASYSDIDSLSFLFDVGISGQMSKFSERDTRVSAYNSTFDYLQLGFRLKKNLGLSAGLRPFSYVGYNFGTRGTITDTGTGDETAATYNYYGTGGVQQVFLGMGYRPFSQLSIGLQASYLFGSLTKTSTVTSAAYTSGSVRKSGSMNIYDYKLEAGLQYTQPLNLRAEQYLTLGATYALGHSSDLQATTITGTQSNDFNTAFSWPHDIGIGLSYTTPQLTAGIDYNLQMWEQTYYEGLNNDATGHNASAQQPLLDRHRISVGVEWVQDRHSSSRFKQLRYRAGAHYATPYYQVKPVGADWKDGPNEWGVSAGLGFPLHMLNRSMVHLSCGYVHTAMPNLLTDRNFRISLGITFNETWFQKLRVR